MDRYEDKRIKAFKVSAFDLSEALNEFRKIGGDMLWRSNPINVFQEGNNYIVIVLVEGYYPYMDSQLEDTARIYKNKAI